MYCLYQALASLTTNSHHSPDESLRSVIAGSTIVSQSARSMGAVSDGSARTGSVAVPGLTDSGPSCFLSLSTR